MAKVSAQIDIKDFKEITRFTHIHIDQSIFGHHDFRIQVPIESIEGEGKYEFKKAKSIIGKTVIINLSSHELEDISSPPFVGIVTNIGFARSHDSSNELVIEGKSPTILMDTGKNFRSFSESSLADVVNKVLENYDLGKYDITCNPDPLFYYIPYIVQYGESDFNFLQRIAARYAEWIYFDGSTLVFGKSDDTSSDSESNTVKLILGRDLYNFELKLALAPTNYETTFYDYSKSETIVKTGASLSDFIRHDPAYGKLTYEQSSKILSAVPSHPCVDTMRDDTDDNLTMHVVNHLKQVSSSMVNLYADGDHPGLGIGKTISVVAAIVEDNTDVDSFGDFVITKIHHYIGGDGDYHNSFQAIPAEAGTPPVNPKIHIPQAQPESAFVVANIDFNEDKKDEPNKMGRIRVQTSWQKDNEKTPWIRLLNAHAGADHGTFVIPEVGDEVIIGYIHQNPDRPFVLGSVYNKINAPADNWYEEKNKIKAFKTMSGNEVIFSDKEGESEIKILNNDGKNSVTMTMNGGSSITISTNNQMNLSGKNITIDASDDLELKGKNITMTAEDDINVKTVNGLINFSAKTNFLAKSEDRMVLTSTNNSVAITGQTGVLLTTPDGNAFLTSDSGAVLVEAKTNLVLKGESSSIHGKEVNVTGDSTNVKGDSIEIFGKSVAVKASNTVDVNGISGVTVKGATVKLNS